MRFFEDPASGTRLRVEAEKEVGEEVRLPTLKLQLSNMIPKITRFEL